MKWLLDPLPVGTRVVLSVSEQTCPSVWKYVPPYCDILTLQLHIVSGFVRLLDFLESPGIVLTSGKLLRNLNEISELLKSLVFSFYVLNVLLSSGHKSTRVSFDHQLSCTLNDSKDSHKL